MSATTLIQIILIINVFIIGFLTPYIVRYAKAHFWSDKDKLAPHLSTVTEPSVHLSAAAKEKLLQDTQVKFQASLEQAVSKLSHDLGSTTEQIDNLVKHLASEIVGNELERYREQLTNLRKQAEEDMSQVKTVIDGHQAELKANLDQEIAAEREKLAQQMTAEKQHLTEQINTKLADAVASFLLEALGHNVDLGSQSTYLTELLEAHKTEFVKEVADESQSTA